MIKLLKTIFFFISLVSCLSSYAQTDTTNFIPVDSLALQAPIVDKKDKIDSVLTVHSPRKAAFRSAVLPGWGQAYNKKYWKIPIVYGALGTAAGFFIYNLNNYRDTRFAYSAKSKASRTPPDSSDFFLIKPELVRLDMEAIRFYRDEFRRNMDYSVLFFILMWGLNVVDATVDAHLKSFDVSPDLSFRIRPGKSEIAGTTGVSLILAFK